MAAAMRASELVRTTALIPEPSVFSWAYSECGIVARPKAVTHAVAYGHISTPLMMKALSRGCNGSGGSSSRRLRCRLIGGGDDGFADRRAGAAGFDGEAGCAGSTHGFDGGDADDGDVKAHVLVGLGDFDDGERAAEGSVERGLSREAAHQLRRREGWWRRCLPWLRRRRRPVRR